MKSVAFVIYDFSVKGGAEIVSCSLANKFTDVYDVHLISVYKSGDYIYNLNSKVSVYTLFDSVPNRLREGRKKAKKLLIDYLKKNSIDVVILEGNYAGFIGSTLKGNVPTKVIYCDHGALSNSFWSLRGSTNDKVITLIRLINAIKSDVVVTLTEQSRNDYHEKLYIRETKLHCIPNWIEDGVCNSNGYNFESKRIISAGRFTEEKGFDQLIKAFAPVAKKYPEWELDIYGDGILMPSLTELVKEYEVEDQVIFPGMVDDLPYRYKDYAMYVLPSYKEGLPLVLLEAKANYLPIISFDILTGPKEIVSDGIDGILVPEKDIKAFSNAIELLISNDVLRNRMSLNSQVNIERFSKENIFGEWRKLIESL